MKLEDFLNFYQGKRNTCLEKDLFSSMLAMYPAALVATADGSFDELEKQNLVAALKVASNENDLNLCEMYADLCYLLGAEELLKEEALKCIAEEIADNAELKLLILEMMISTAEAEDGISDVEKEKINELKGVLSI